MKRRYDFVTNSSSASFLIGLRFESDTGKHVYAETGVCSEGLFTDDGCICADCLSLTPVDDNGDICFGDVSLSSVSNIDDLVDALFDAICVENYICSDDWDLQDDDEIDVPGSSLFKKTISGLKKDLRKKGIDKDNLVKIVVSNIKDGHGDSAIWVPFDNSGFSEFEKRISSTMSEEEVGNLVKDMVSYIETRPVLDVVDESDNLTAVCVWDASRCDLVKAIGEWICDPNGTDYWMATDCTEYVIDVKKHSLFKQHVVRFGSLE